NTHIVTLWVGEVAWIDHWLIGVVTGTQTNRTARTSVGDGGRQRKGLILVRVPVTTSMHRERHGTVVHHQVRQIQAVFGRGEDTDFPPLGGITSHRNLGFPGDDGFWMILQVRTNAWSIDPNIDAVFCKVF